MDESFRDCPPELLSAHARSSNKRADEAGAQAEAAVDKFASLVEAS